MGSHGFSFKQGTHCTGKTRRVGKNNSGKENREFGNFAKTQGNWFAQVVNSLILTGKDILIFQRENFQFL